MSLDPLERLSSLKHVRLSESEKTALRRVLINHTVSYRAHSIATQKQKSFIRGFKPSIFFIKDAYLSKLLRFSLTQTERDTLQQTIRIFMQTHPSTSLPVSTEQKSIWANLFPHAWSRLISEVLHRGKSIHLTPEERAITRQHIESFIHSYPQYVQNSGARVDRRHGWVNYSVRATRPMIAALSFFLVTVLGFGISSASEHSLPGDGLYPVKTHINENLAQLAAITPQSQSGWHVKQAERRIKELERLAVHEKLSDQNQAHLKSQVVYHIEKIHQTVLRLQDQNKLAEAAWINSQLEAVLHSHIQLLDHVTQEMRNTSGTNTSVSYTNLMATIEPLTVAKDKTCLSQASIEELKRTQDVATFRAKAEELRTQSWRRIQSVQYKLDSHNNGKDPEFEKGITTVLGEARDARTSADDFMAKVNYIEAAIQYQNALRLTHEAEILIDNHITLESILNAKSSGTSPFNGNLPATIPPATENKPQLITPQTTQPLP